MQQAVVQALTQSGSLVSDIAGGSISADLLDYLRRPTQSNVSPHFVGPALSASLNVKKIQTDAKGMRFAVGFVGQDRLIVFVD